MAIETQGEVRTLHGMTVVENVQGPAAAFLGLFNAPAMTLGSDFAFATETLADKERTSIPTGGTKSWDTDPNAPSWATCIRQRISWIGSPRTWYGTILIRKAGTSHYTMPIPCRWTRT